MKLLCYIPVFFALIWTKYMEAKGKHDGIPLDENQKSLFSPLGIHDIDKVRLCYTSRISHPLDFLFKHLGPYTDKIISSPIGLTLGHTIYIKSKYKNSLNLLAHEIVHVRQYESHGGQLSFLAEYIYQCWKYGYTLAPLEQEAVQMSHELISKLNKDRYLA